MLLLAAIVVIVTMACIPVSNAFKGLLSPSGFVVKTKGDQVAKSLHRLLAGSKFVSTGANNAVNINGNAVTAEKLKNLRLTNVEGETVTVGSLTGNGKSVVVFLRHMG